MKCLRLMLTRGIGDHNAGELTVVGSGKRAYLRAGVNDANGVEIRCAWIDNNVTLRRFLVAALRRMEAGKERGDAR